MMQKRKTLRKNRRGFTGLEAAIVLTAFVVVAAVFSYVVLNAGFFTTQKAKQVVHTGVEQATSSLELAGDVIAHTNTSMKQVEHLNITVQLTAGHNAIDLSASKLIVATANKTTYNANVSEVTTWIEGSSWMLDPTEKAQVKVPITLNTNEVFTVELKPSLGATLSIERMTPADLSDKYINLH